MDEYKSTLNKIKAGESFKTRTISLLLESEKTESKIHKRTKLIPILATCLVMVIAFTLLVMPFTSHSEHSFTIKANAESILTDTDFTPISDISAAQLGFIGLDLSEIAPMLDSGDEITGSPNILNKAFLSLTVEGENIESIHLELNDGFFEVADDVTHKIIDSTPKSDNNTTGMMEDFSYFDTITLDYSDQIAPISKHFEGDWVTMNILHPYNEEIDKELIDNLLNLSVFKPDPQQEFEDEEYFEATFENFLNEMYKNTEIYVTCKFSDGKTLTKTLKLTADCEIIGTKEEYYFTGDSYFDESSSDDEYEMHEVYDYTVKLCAKIV